MLFLSIFQFNDALMYTTPVQSAQFKLNSVLSLAGMKVCDFVLLCFSSLITNILLILIGLCKRKLTKKHPPWSVLVLYFQVSKPSQEAYQNELNIESVERSFILSARSALLTQKRCVKLQTLAVTDERSCTFMFAVQRKRETSGWRLSAKPSKITPRRK